MRQGILSYLADNQNFQAALLGSARAALESIGGTASVSTGPRGFPIFHAGVFVTLREHEKLRGCIGTLSPGRELFAAVGALTLAAAREDPRFPPLAAEDIPRTRVELSVLGPVEKIRSWNEIQTGRHGIVLELEGRQSVFLPNVPAEYGWNLEQTLAALCAKADLPEGAWRDAHYRIFEAFHFSETSK